ncbi:MAG: hypothetical protein IKD00_05625 [Candidatus Methanomethylophilaceae archaeon]|nr:hypothetical protein [Candidatus Methanomethylophilaceae archaeon]
MRRALGNASWVVMVNGGASQYNTKAIMEMGHEYPTRKTMGANDVAFFENGEAVGVEPGLTCVSHMFGSSGG